MVQILPPPPSVGPGMGVEKLDVGKFPLSLNVAFFV